MNVPAELRYSSDHEWVRRAGNVVTIGITEYAQDSLGDIVFVEAPDAGSVGLRNQRPLCCSRAE